MAELIIRDLVRNYGSYKAIDNVSLTVADGEFMTLLGPSGCGKSTTLNAIAGLDQPTSGFISVDKEVFFDGSTGRFVEAEGRNLGLVFQSYALWPHMTVRENVGFALRLRRVKRTEREEKIRQTLALVEMESYIDRYPSELSGGQQQRVALARTLAYRPRILLLDEPLSNLDAKLRDKARSWLKQLQSQVGITTIFVTHDQVEALSLSDRIAVMNEGRIMQLGTPREIYETPTSQFVADFIGTSNFLIGMVMDARNGSADIRLSDGQMIQISSTKELGVGTTVTVGFRPERMRVVREAQRGHEANVVKARVAEVFYLGPRLMYTLVLGQDQIKVESLDPIEGTEIHVALPVDGCAVFS